MKPEEALKRNRHPYFYYNSFRSIDNSDNGAKMYIERNVIIAWEFIE
jgi:hypothetical protein